MAETNIKRILKVLVLAGIILVLFIPLLQQITRFKPVVRPLQGSFNQEKDLAFSWPLWFNGDFQDQKEKYLKENFGLRNDYVRLHAQLNFSLFRKAGAAFVVVGKDNYLFETGYINAYYGHDFIGSRKIEEYMRQLRCVQDTLSARNKLMVVVLAPGKASYYPEYIPDHYKRDSAQSNYLCFSKALLQHQIHHLDFNRHFREQKSRSRFPLYPQFGIHWSMYGSVLAFDSLVRYTESMLQTDLPDVVIGEPAMSDSLRHTDADVLKGMNLMAEPETFPMAYATYSVSYDSTRHKKPRLLVIADSFWWYIFDTNLPGSVFSDQQFWYYNEAVYPASFGSPLYVKETDYFTAIRQADVIVLMHSESTLSRFGDGFVEMCYATFCQQDPHREKLQRMKGLIRATPEWYQTIIKKSEARHISVDSMLTLDAIFMLNQQK